MKRLAFPFLLSTFCFLLSAAAQPQYLNWYASQPTSGGGGAGDITTSLTAFWHLDESSGTAPVDSAGSITTAAANANWVTGHKNNAYQLDGTSSYFVYSLKTSCTALLPGTSDFTVNVWVKTSATVSGAVGIAGKWRDFGEVGRYTLAIVANNLSAYVETSAGVVVVSVAESVINNGAWHMITLVAHRNANLELWVDGTSRGTPVSIAADAAVNYAPDDVWLLGAYGDVNGIGAAAGSYFNGAVDEARVYIGRALVSADIAALYALP